ncbi:MAG: hypothetical protein ABI832_08155 [bacterium]
MTKAVNKLFARSQSSLFEDAASVAVLFFILYVGLTLSGTA